MLLQLIVWPAIAVCAALLRPPHLRRAGDGDQAGAGARMSGLAVAALGFGAMLLLIALRMPVGLSMLVVGAVGYIHLSSWPAFFAYMKTNPYHQFANYTLSVIPLFILMGALAERSGLSRDLFRAARRLRRASARRPGDGRDLAPARCSAPSADRRSRPRRPSAGRRCPSCALQVRRRLCHRHDRGRRHARHLSSRRPSSWWSMPSPPSRTSPSCSRRR